MVTDIIADGITRLRNGGMRGLRQVTLLGNKTMREILKVLQNEGYIEEFTTNGQNIDVKLKYFQSKPVIKYIERISKCSRRIYTGVEEMPKPKYNYGLFILSTNLGIKTNIEAKKLRVGGEILLEVF